MTKSTDNPELEEKKIKPLDEGDLDILKSYGLGPYAIPSKKLGLEINEMVEKVKKLVGIKESDTGLALPSLWDLAGDKQMMQEQQPLLVARCTKIINPGSDEAKYIISLRQIAKFVVGLGEKVLGSSIIDHSY